MKNTIIISLLCVVVIAGGACKKELAAKPDIHLATISTLADVQALLDYTPTMKPDIGADEASADNYYFKQETLDGLEPATYVNMYTWAKDNQFNTDGNEWNDVYRKIYTCNTALKALGEIRTTDVAKQNELRGQALFHRGRSFFQVAVTWAKAYSSTTAATDPGIPLRLTTDFDELSIRASVAQTYEQIVNDLTESAGLLPALGLSKERPSIAAAFAQLSRVYLSMANFEKSKAYSDSALAIQNALLDYNVIDGSNSFPFEVRNAEVIYDAFADNSLTSYYDAIVDTTLYVQYANDDLRRDLFFADNGNGGFAFRGNYTGSPSRFSGLCTDELYLTRAECKARLNDLPGALNDLNALLQKRWLAGTFVPITATTSSAALDIILTERRKELPYRFVRWMDIKRLNLLGTNVVLHRIYNGELITLAPNSDRYALAIPESVIAISGMPQNPR